jgi:hypothetical protein
LKSVDGAQKGSAVSAARNVTETKFIWKNRKLKRPYKRSFLIQMALTIIDLSFGLLFFDNRNGHNAKILFSVVYLRPFSLTSLFFDCAKQKCIASSPKTLPFNFISNFENNFTRHWIFSTENWLLSFEVCIWLPDIW